ncbi:GntR family transcriptional regulator [Burkholderiaceae bacterium DAT-1]|nr:GntR family transcriptional regulator [Burkholderiaceae bacterium DAT-1]
MSTLVDKIVSEIRDDILNGVLLPAQALKQVELANRYGVSPIPLREALQRLQVDGLVEYFPYRGAIVARIRRSEIVDIADLRIALETMALKLTVGALDEEQIERMDEVASRLSGPESNTPKVFMDLLLSFYSILLARSNRPLLLNMIQTNLKRATLYYAELIKHPLRASLPAPTWQQIATAIRAGDTDLTIRYMNERVISFRDFFLEHSSIE